MATASDKAVSKIVEASTFITGFLITVSTFLEGRGCDTIPCLLQISLARIGVALWIMVFLLGFIIKIQGEQVHWFSECLLWTFRIGVADLILIANTLWISWESDAERKASIVAGCISAFISLGILILILVNSVKRHKTKSHVVLDEK